MIYIQIFLAFFIPGIVGYGGGPSSIPLVQHEVVDKYQWMTVEEFSEVLALGNALPGPIATKMAGYIGYTQGGTLGAIIAVFASVAPSLLLMIALMATLHRYKDSPQVKSMTMLVRPTIAVLLGVLAYRFFESSYLGAGTIQTGAIAVVSYLLLEFFKVHPSLVIIGALVYGAVFLTM